MDNVAKQKEFSDEFKAGAKFALDEAAKWIGNEIHQYVTWEGEIEKEELIADLKKECLKNLGL